NYTSYAATPSSLCAAKSMVWGLGAGLTAPLFDGGALRAEKRASEQAFNAAGATYRQTIIKAFQNVADALTALQQDDATETARQQAATAAETSLKLALQSYDAGAQPLASVLIAEQQVENAHLASEAAHAARLADCVALYQALGGRWDQVESKNQAKKGVKP
ncbi:MAG: TolC family protein, partial [Pseudomonadales bacterium]|nr:TolC family protein [Pseudomonadales bacterium]